MKLKVVQIGKVTTNGNRIVKLQGSGEVETELGMKDYQITYYTAVKDKTIKVKVDSEVDIDLTKFRIVERPYLDENGELPVDNEGNVIDDGNGNPIMLKWLHLRAA